MLYPQQNDTREDYCFMIRCHSTPPHTSLLIHLLTHFLKPPSIPIHTLYFCPPNCALKLSLSGIWKGREAETKAISTLQIQVISDFYSILFPSIIQPSQLNFYAIFLHFYSQANQLYHSLRFLFLTSSFFIYRQWILREVFEDYCTTVILCTTQIYSQLIKTHCMYNVTWQLMICQMYISLKICNEQGVDRDLT